MWSIFQTFLQTLSPSAVYINVALTDPIVQAKYQKITKLLDIPNSTTIIMKLAITKLVGWPLPASLRT